MIDTILYDRLGISPNSTEEEIKKEGKKLLLKYHPDKNENKEEATKKFIEIKEALDILTDKKKRELYHINGIKGANDINNINNSDSRGMPGFTGVFQGMPPGFMFSFPHGFPGINRGSSGFPGMNRGPQGFHGMPFDFMFNFVNSSANNDKIDPKEQKDINCTIKVDVPTIQENSKFDIVYNRNIYCNECDGKGTIEQNITINNMNISSFNSCRKCFGRTFLIEQKKVVINLDKESLLKLIETKDSIIIVDQGNIYKEKTTNLIVKFTS
jgi:DnaJ-class molecular chaperone